MQSEVPTSKRHWNAPAPLADTGIPPLNNEDLVDSSTMKTVEDVPEETTALGADTEDETDRQSSGVTSLQDGGGKVNEGTTGDPELVPIPGDRSTLSLAVNGSPILAGKIDFKADDVETREDVPKTGEMQHPDDSDENRIDTKEGEKHASGSSPADDQSEMVLEDESQRSSPVTLETQIEASLDIPVSKCDRGQSSDDPNEDEQCVARTSSASSNALERSHTPHPTLDSPEHGDVPNGVAKMECVQGYDNETFSADDESKPPSTDTEPEGGRKALTNSSPHVPRRVSFSERPPLRAVYDNGNASSGAPIDPAARAVKEQGLGPGEKWRVLRNVTIISAAFMVLFTAFFGAANLQSSVNPTGGLGTVSLTAVYAALIVSNLFLPSIVIKRVGCKWTVALGMLLFTPYAVAQMAASWGSLVPTALLAGVAGAPMWCAKCSYLNAAAGAYSAVTGSPRDLVMVRFFGLFYVLFPLGHVWGNLITSEVLSTNARTANVSLSALDVAAVCGANFCPAARSAEENPNLARPPDHLITTIAALFIALSLLSALLVAFGVDNLRRYGERLGEDTEMGPEGGGNGGAALLVATLRLLGDRNQLMLVPITAFIGISQAFLGADFTESYIACAWGIPYIGYVLMGYGLASSLASVLVSWAVKRAGRLPVVVASIALFLVLVGVLRWWTPQPRQGAAFVLLAAAWGLADSTALVINAMYGLLFRGREAAAYSNFSLWGSAGFIVTYSYSPHLCAVTKLAILAAVLFLSLLGFVVAELALRRILAAEAEAKTREEALTGAGISVISDKAHAA